VRKLLLFTIVLAAAVGAAVAVMSTQRDRLASMDREERRRYLGEKLGGRMSDDQVDKIVEAISAKLDAAKVEDGEQPGNGIDDSPVPASDDGDTDDTGS
jgi:hypothetical protein